MDQRRRKIQILHLFLRSTIGPAYDATLVKQYAGAVKSKPRERQANDDGDVDRLAKPCLRDLVIDRVEQANQLMLFELPEASRSNLDRLLRRRAG